MTIRQIWPHSGPMVKAVIAVYVLAFCGATFNHVLDLLNGGLFPYTQWWGVPPVLNIYWTSLTILDPLAIVLLFLCIPAGCALYLGIMVSDVAINMYASVVYWKQPLFHGYGLILQTLFLIFLVITLPVVFKSIGLYKASTKANIAAKGRKEQE